MAGEWSWVGKGLIPFLNVKEGEDLIKKWLLDFHIYLGLFCAGYMVIYGLSTLSFNHKWRPTEERVTWQREVTSTVTSSDQALGEALRDSLNLLGWVPYWRIQRRSDGTLMFDVERPAKSYRIQWNNNQARVTELRRGVWGAMRGMHGLSGLPRSSWGKTWSIYTEISIWAMVFSVLSGVYFWWLRKSARKAGAWLLVSGSVGTILFMLYIWW